MVHNVVLVPRRVMPARMDSMSMSRTRQFKALAAGVSTRRGFSGGRARLDCLGLFTSSRFLCQFEQEGTRPKKEDGSPGSVDVGRMNPIQITWIFSRESDSRIVQGQFFPNPGGCDVQSPRSFETDQAQKSRMADRWFPVKQ